jgi:hypothetical protein
MKGSHYCNRFQFSLLATLILLAAVLCSLNCSLRAAILVGPSGLGPLTFDITPKADEFVTGVLAGNATTFAHVATLDAGVASGSLRGACEGTNQQLILLAALSGQSVIGVYGRPCPDESARPREGAGRESGPFQSFLARARGRAPMQSYSLKGISDGASLTACRDAWQGFAHRLELGSRRRIAESQRRTPLAPYEWR